MCVYVYRTLIFSFLMKTSSKRHTNRADPMDLERMKLRLKQIGIDDRTSRRLLRDSTFCNLECRNHQISYLNDFIKEQEGQGLPIGSLEQVFGVTENVIRRSLNAGLDEILSPGRHIELPENVEDEIVQKILKEENDGTPMKPKEVVLFASELADLPLTKGWLQTFLLRKSEEIQRSVSYPQNQNRVFIPRVYFTNHFHTMNVYITGKASELVFNLDEVGISPWEDKKVRKVIVGKKSGNEVIFHKVNRNIKHITMVNCISAAGDTLTPLIISQASDFTEIWAKGYRQDEDVMLRTRNPAYIDTELFNEYLDIVFIPYINSLRKNPLYTDEPAVLLMDNCSSHCSDEILQKLAENNVYVITFPPHTTNILQMLDLVNYGVFKKKNDGAQKKFDKNDTINEIIKIINSYEATFIGSNIRGAFNRGGIFINIKESPNRLRFDENKVKHNPGFQEIWNMDTQIDSLSARARNQEYGCINQKFFNQDQ